MKKLDCSKLVLDYYADSDEELLDMITFDMKRIINELATHRFDKTEYNRLIELAKDLKTVSIILNK